MLWHMIITKKKAGFYSNTSKGNTKLDWQLNHSDNILFFIRIFQDGSIAECFE